MWCTVTVHGVPFGTVELKEYELTSGIMEPLNAYQAVRPKVRRGSAALLSVGFYGTAALAAGEGDPATIEALSEAAALRFAAAGRVGGATRDRHRVSFTDGNKRTAIAMALTFRDC